MQPIYNIFSLYIIIFFLFIIEFILSICLISFCDIRLSLNDISNINIFFSSGCAKAKIKLLFSIFNFSFFFISIKEYIDLVFISKIFSKV